LNAFTIALTRSGRVNAAINSFRGYNLIEPLWRLRSVSGREEPLSFRRRLGKRKRPVLR